MFVRKDVARVASASTGSQAMWLYLSATDSLADALSPDYFGEISPQLRTNDVLCCRLSDRYCWLQVEGRNPAINSVTVNQIDFITQLGQQGLVNWMDDWQQGIYEKNDQVLDNGWLMIANQTTAERPSPQNNGDPTYSLPTTPLWTENTDPSVVFSGQQYTFTESGWVNSIRVWIPEITENTNYRFIIVIEAPGKNPETITIEEPILNVNLWTTLIVGTRLITEGTIVTFWIDALNSGASTNISGGWRYAGTSQDIAPPAEGWTQDNQRTNFRIDKGDLDSQDRSTELEGVIPESTISVVQTDDVGRTATYRVRTVTDNITHMLYETVMLTETGGNVAAGAVTTIDISVPISLPTKYEELPGEWPGNSPTWATVEGRLAFGDIGNIQAGSELNAYGVDLLFQPALISEHWDIAALSGDGGSSNTNAQYGDSVVVQNTNQLTAKSFDIQNPLGLGLSNKIQVEFGPQQLPALDEFGTYISQNRGQKTFSISLNFERINSGGVATLWIYSELNGIKKSAQVIKLDTHRQRVNFIFTVIESIEIGDEIKVFLFRDANEINDGGLYPVISNEIDIPNAISALLEVTNLVVSP